MNKRDASKPNLFTHYFAVKLWETAMLISPFLEKIICNLDRLWEVPNSNMR